MRRKIIIISYLEPASIKLLVGLCLLICTGITLSLSRGRFLIWTTVPPGAIAGKVVVLDPGHGGIDPGCTGKSGVQEKGIVLEVAKLIGEELKKHNLRIILTRERDQALAENGDPRLPWKRRDLNARVEIANQAKADLFISVHANSFPEPIWSGAQTFYHGASPQSKLLAESIQDSLVGELGPNRRRALAADYRVLRESKMPAAVVEIGFLSNPREETLLQDPAYQRKAARAVAAGIITYFVEQHQASRGKVTRTVSVSAKLERTLEQMRRLRGGLAQDQILLYFEGLDPNDDSLVPVVHKLAVSKETLSTQQLAQVIVEELIGGPKANSVLYRTIPPEARLLGLKLQGDTATVNFSQEFITKHWGGSWSEELTIYSLVNSLTELPQIKRVQILVEGESNVSIGGHVFLDQVFQRRDDVVLPVRSSEGIERR
jgi:N-acetylmuramoyl-L-alanine amidase